MTKRKEVKNEPFRWLMCPFFKARTLEIYNTLKSPEEKLQFEMRLCFVIAQGYHDKLDYQTKWKAREKWLEREGLNEFKGLDY